ncbi:HAD family phosphatase [Bacillus sp. ISL-40]|uniref:Cof-type HAD-IIB family hydrolase n=1 Tax=unclassified Bacillus (in: firmicutes) TaxID=185979 RepID=UPI001BE76408|nr:MULTISPECIES: Cof-type HAD-IIB family hydrolase [unclassified Bacillus (in: firmicutes)]MBT2697447.1 HAD family phosphatase [Bacillus sp. ISL-40]MBT2721003.1 HAD family phosphatase [Bacillus sp. ISL-46]MBT2741737.1 HAD family phosphatase [Bacillus sp. ISL-77]
MGNFKMVCLDIDGTLLNSRHEITEKTKQVIQKVAIEKQIPVILVSARMPKGIKFLQQALNIVQPIICYSGAFIWNNRDTLLNITIPVSDVKQVYNIVKSIGIHISLYKDDEWYIEEMDDWAKQESEITNITPSILDFSTLFMMWEQGNTGPNKILCMAESHKIHQLDVKINDYLSSYLNIYPSKPTYLEIMPKHTTKTSAIEFLCKEFDILKNEIIAIGDNYNDMNMIEFAGLGIAMGNAPEQVKQIANDITLSNDEDGVAEALKKYILS